MKSICFGLKNVESKHYFESKEKATPVGSPLDCKVWNSQLVSPNSTSEPSNPEQCEVVMAAFQWQTVAFDRDNQKLLILLCLINWQPLAARPVA